ncbi:MAG: hypothetical protein JW869_01390 [Candidatus Omnitrophica bacterium]|nr:hypothetical protein [Candidatus Omnitrophota bacterium]
MMKKADAISLILLFLVAIFFISSCGQRVEHRTPDQLISYFNSKGLDVQSVFDYSESRDTKKIAQVMGGRTVDVTVEGITVMIVERKDAASAKRYVEFESKAVPPPGLEDVKLIPHVSHNLVVLFKKKDYKSIEAQRVLMKLKAF